MKKNFRKIMSAFLALVMVLTFGATTAFAAEPSVSAVEVEEILSVSQNARSNSYTTTGTSFTRYVTSDKMYMSGTSISVGLYGLSNWAIGSSFTVTPIRVAEDGTVLQTYSSREVGGNDDDTTLIWAGMPSGYYKFKFAKENNGLVIFDQAIDTILYYSA